MAPRFERFAFPLALSTAACSQIQFGDEYNPYYATPAKGAPAPFAQLETPGKTDLSYVAGECGWQGQ